MKKWMLLFSISLLFITIYGMTTPAYLIKIDRQIAYRHYQVNDLSALMQKLPSTTEVYYASANYLLIGAGKRSIPELPRSAYTILDEFPLSENYYLLTRLPGRSDKLASSVCKIISEMDQTILIQSGLTESELGKQTDMPFVRMDFVPVPIRSTGIITPNPNTRVDYGNLLNQVNADSIVWFIQQMQNMGTRYVGAPNCLQVSSWVRDQFIRFGYTNAELDQFIVQDSQQWNVVATLPGTLAPGKLIVIGGHHDSVVYDGNNPVMIAPGADDNASGTAAVLEIARIMKLNNYQPECTIKFVTFAAEESGLWGSRHYAQVAQQQSQNIKIMINHDMISNSTQTSDNWLVRLLPYEGYTGYTYLAMGITEDQTSLTTYAGSLNSSGSDSFSFWQRGFPSIYFEEHEFSPNYHTISDLVANINPMYVKEIVKASTAIAITYDQLPSPVSGVQIADTGNGTSLQATWSNLGLESDVVSYKVYVTPDLQITPVEYTTSLTTYTIPNLTAGQMYYIGVAAFDINGNGGLTYTVTGTPNIIPQTPYGFNDMPNMHSVVLNWSANQELDIAGYRIYRSISEEGPYTVLNGDLLTTTSYQDLTVSDLVYYYYKVTAVDNDLHESTPTGVVRTRALTLNQGILVIDETRNNPGNTVFAPNDLVSDQFFDEVFNGFTISHFDTETDGTLKLADIGIYSSVFWHGNDFGNMTYPYLVRDEISKYIRAGGKILISSYLPTQAFENNNNYPFTFTPGNYMFDEFGIHTTAYDNRARFKYALPGDSGLPPLTVDTLKTIVPLNGHIYTIESIGAIDDAQNIYYYGSDYLNTTNQGIMNGLPVGIMYPSGLGTAVLLSFPLYNMYQSDVQTLMNSVFNQLFDEPFVANDDVTQIPSELQFSRIYPNPFNGNIRIELNQSKPGKPLNIAVYNVKGQKVKSIFTGISKDKVNYLSWDGKDEQGNSVSSSIYFIKAEQGDRSISRKLIKLN